MKPLEKTEEKRTHHPDSPSTLYRRDWRQGGCAAFESSPDGGEYAEMGNRLEDAVRSGDVTDLTDEERRCVEWCREIIAQEDCREHAAWQEWVEVRDGRGKVFTSGWLDFGSWTSGKMGYVCDLKFGFNPVAAPLSNIQLLLYGLGLVQRKSLEECRLAIAQPRHPNPDERYRTGCIRPADAKWIVREAKRIIREHRAPTIRLTPSDGVCQYCAELPTCPSARRLTELSITERAARSLNPTTVSRRLKMLDFANKYRKEYRRWAQSELAEKGVDIPGYTLKTKRGDRSAGYQELWPVCQGVIPLREYGRAARMSLGEIVKLYRQHYSEQHGCLKKEAEAIFWERAATVIEQGEPTTFLEAVKE